MSPQKKLKDGRMSDAAYLDQAARWAKDLTWMRARGQSDMKNAMRSLEKDYGIKYWLTWQLRYRRDRLKFVSGAVFERLKAAYSEECKLQMRKLQHEIENTERITGPNNAAVLAAKALVGAAEGEVSP